MEGTCFESDWAAVAAGTSALRGLLGRLHQAGSERLGPMFAELDELKMLTEAAQVGVLDQGLSRGDVRASDAASSAGWVRQWGPSYRAGGAAALVRVAEGVAKPCNGVLRGAVLGARVPVRNAAVALGEMDKLLHRLTPACAETVLGGFVAIAESDGPREIRGLRPRVIAKYGRLAEFQRREDQLKHGRSLSQPYADDGMAEYRLRLDPEGRAVLEAILGPLAAPQPSTEHGSDLRSSDQRRADALVEVCRRAAAAGGSAPATAKAAVVVTMTYQDLLERTGAGATLTGERSPPRPCGGSPATPRSSRPSSAPRGRRSTWAGRCGWRPRNRCRHCGSGTRGARSRAARGPHPGATHIMFGIGAKGARRTC